MLLFIAVVWKILVIHTDFDMEVPNQEFVHAVKNPQYLYLEQSSRYHEVAALAKFLGVEGQGEYNLLTKLSHCVTTETLRTMARKTADVYGKLLTVDNTRLKSPFSCFIHIAVHEQSVPYETRLYVFGRKVKKSF